MGAFEQLQAVVQGMKVQRTGDMEGVKPQLRRMNPAGKDRVLVLFAGCRETGMKRRICFFRTINPDGSGKHGIQAADDCFAGNFRTGPEVSNHPLCVDACIRSARSVQNNFFRGHHGKAAFYFTLDGAVVFLPLPATISRPVIADEQFDSAWPAGLLRRHGGRKQISQGKNGTMPRPAVSAKPHMMFIFCTACPEAPLTMLSMVDITMIRSVAGSIL